MENNDLISTERFCEYHQVEFSFINSLNEHGLVDIVSIEEVKYLPISQLREVEKMIRLHYDLEINVEGLEAISHLLQRMDHLQKELGQLKNRLDFYKGGQLS